jgi:hypothetical protein
LNEKYKEEYYALSLLVGSGNISSLSFDEPIFKKNELALPIIGSLEESCMKQGTSCFFYPTEYLPNTALRYRKIGNMYHEYWSNDYEYLKNKIDGFIFTKKSQALYEQDMKGPHYQQLQINRMINHLDTLKKIESDAGLKTEKENKRQ